MAAMAVGFLGFIFVLSWRINRTAIATLELQGQLEVAKENAENANVTLARLATTDELTSVLNRRAFFEKAERELWRAVRYEHPMSVVLIDVDHFKAVNDNYGHAVGDEVLVALAGMLEGALRQSDVVARLGGEEFAVLLPETDGELALKITDRLRQTIEGSPMRSRAGAIELTVSAGIAERKADTTSVADLLDRADTALYAAKDAGRNRVASD